MRPAVLLLACLAAGACSARVLQQGGSSPDEQCRERVNWSYSTCYEASEFRGGQQGFRHLPTAATASTCRHLLAPPCAASKTSSPAPPSTAAGTTPPEPPVSASQGEALAPEAEALPGVAQVQATTLPFGGGPPFAGGRGFATASGAGAPIVAAAIAAPASPGAPGACTLAHRCPTFAHLPLPSRPTPRRGG